MKTLNYKFIEFLTGCTEQSFKSWIPNIVAFEYLNATGKLNSVKKAQIEGHMSAGYQRITAAHNLFKQDGSISVWGEKDGSSLWVTAYMVKILTRAKHLIKTIDDKKTSNALNFLKSKLKTNGEFGDSSQHKYYYLTTETQSGVPLTAFIVSAFLESDYSDDFRATIKSGVDFVLGKSSAMTDNFEKSITAYMLSLYLKRFPSSNEGVNDAFNHVMESLLDSADYSMNNKAFWYRKNSRETISSVHIETASYALMAFLASRESAKHAAHLEMTMKIANWLLSQKNPNGGFKSTFDTGELIGVVAIS